MMHRHHRRDRGHLRRADRPLSDPRRWPQGGRGRPSATTGVPAARSATRRLHPRPSPSAARPARPRRSPTCGGSSWRGCRSPWRWRSRFLGVLLGHRGRVGFAIATRRSCDGGVALWIRHRAYPEPQPGRSAAAQVPLLGNASLAAVLMALPLGMALATGVDAPSDAIAKLPSSTTRPAPVRRTDALADGRDRRRADALFAYSRAPPRAPARRRLTTCSRKSPAGRSEGALPARPPPGAQRAVLLAAAASSYLAGSGVETALAALAPRGGDRGLLPEPLRRENRYLISTGVFRCPIALAMILAAGGTSRSWSTSRGLGVRQLPRCDRRLRPALPPDGKPWAMALNLAGAALVALVLALNPTRLDSSSPCSARARGRSTYGAPGSRSAGRTGSSTVPYRAVSQRPGSRGRRCWSGAGRWRAEAAPGEAEDRAGEAAGAAQLALMKLRCLPGRRSGGRTRANVGDGSRGFRDLGHAVEHGPEPAALGWAVPGNQHDRCLHRALGGDVDGDLGLPRRLLRAGTSAVDGGLAVLRIGKVGAEAGRDRPAPGGSAAGGAGGRRAGPRAQAAGRWS